MKDNTISEGKKNYRASTDSQEFANYAKFLGAEIKIKVHSLVVSELGIKRRLHNGVNVPHPKKSKNRRLKLVA